jgi:hypothetical protein
MLLARAHGRKWHKAEDSAGYNFGSHRGYNLREVGHCCTGLAAKPFRETMLVLRLSISMATLKTHLTSIFSKTRTPQQKALISLVLKDTYPPDR